MVNLGHNRLSWALYGQLAMTLLIGVAAMLWPPAGIAETKTHEDAGITLGIFPRRPALKTQEMFQPLATQLSNQLGIPVKLEVPPDFSALWSNIQDDRYQLIHYNPYHYLRARQTLGHRLIAMNEENGQRVIRSALWVRKDSDIRNASVLRHAKIVFGGGRDAMVSFIMATDLLQQAGLRKTDYITQFTINPAHALRAVYYHQSQAAGFHEHDPTSNSFDADLDISQLTPLLISDPVSQHPWAVSSSVTPRLEMRIKNALLTLRETPQGRDALTRAGLSALVEADDQDYGPHRRIIERVLGETY